MIQTIVTHHCPKCGSENLVRNGHDYKGDHKYHCKSCGWYGMLAAMESRVEDSVWEEPPGVDVDIESDSIPVPSKVCQPNI
jgi:uncharacterized Zn finger protein